MRGHKRFLRHVQRFVGIAEEGARKPEHRLPIASHDLGESGLSAGDAERRQFAIRQRGPIEAHPWPSVSAFTTASSN